MLVKNTANSQMVLRINGEDRVLQPFEAVEVGHGDELLEQNAELREVKKVKVEGAKEVDQKQWELVNHPLLDGKVLKRVNNTYEEVDEFVYQEVSREILPQPTKTVVIDSVEDLPFADGRVSKSKATVAQERKSGQAEADRVKESRKA